MPSQEERESYDLEHTGERVGGENRMHFVSKGPSIKLKTLHAGNEKIEKSKDKSTP